MKNDRTTQNAANETPDTLRQEINDLLKRVDRLPRIDSRTEEEILGYDENGLPT